MYNTMRISGLASGIDTEEMIQSMMRAERVKVDRVEQDRQLILWRQEAYNNLNKTFANFIMNSRRLFGLTQVTRTGTFRPNSYQNLNWVKKATSSDENVATVTTNSNVMDGHYSVEVKQLADGVTAASSGEIDGTTNLREMLGLDVNGDSDDVIQFSINGKQFVIGNLEKDDDGNIIDERVIPKVENGEIVGYEASFIDGSLVNIKLSDIARLINSATTEDGQSLGIRASYDSTIDRFFLQTTDTGKEEKIEIDVNNPDEESLGKKFIEKLNLNINHYIAEDEGYVKSSENFKIGTAYYGSDTIINFNGAEGITSPTNRITINGITMDLKSKGNFNINVATDVDGIYEKIEEFINDYNELVETTNKLLGEKQYRDYRPLTAEQRKAMDREDIELWEEKAKSGLLRSDDIIGRTMGNIRRSIYERSEEFSGSFKFITEIGISTEEYAKGSAGGKLVIDEQKLKAALAKDPEGVMELLFKESDKEKDEIGGIVTRIHENMMEGMESIIKKSGTGGENDLYRNVKSNILLDFVSEYSSISLLDKDVLQFSRRIDDLNAMLYRKENHYYAKFAAMEKAISRMNQQSAWMMQQFMG